ncbi:hypothetical protein K7X08_013895 [Anisodus acutangulus]|uniref:Uncharacterized protein n=1 Tax=Anisodus acutangulus TaxID=402998 RepID=A0A9Q1LMG0_9SOLA|nr:hypothetical protein K7X08_013895 [Anisodus acutangulus]
MSCPKKKIANFFKFSFILHEIWSSILEPRLILSKLLLFYDKETEDTLETPQVNVIEVAEEYNYEPGTGVKYRSLREVERRLNGEIFAPRTSASTVRNYPKASVRVEVLYLGRWLFMMESIFNPKINFAEQDPASFASSEFLNFMKFVLQLTQIDLLTIPCIVMWRASLLHMWM